MSSPLRHSLAALFLAVPGLALQAPAPTAAGIESRLVEIGMNESLVEQHLETITRAIGPRLTASPGLDKAYAWTRHKFESFGLNAWIEKYDEWDVGFARGPSHGTVFVEGEEPVELLFMTSAWTRGTDGPERGRALLVPTSLAELESWEDPEGGFWLVQGPRARLAGDERREFQMAMRDWPGTGNALGTIRASRSNLLLQGGRPISDIEVALGRPLSITLTADEHKSLVERLRDDEELEIEFDIRNRFVPGPIALNNVVAEIVGSEHPDEFVLVQAHLDSWDIAEGACDNGTGVATTLEAARILSQLGVKPKRTIRFCLYSGEEQGLYGSRAYTEMHADELSSISIVLNHDNGTNYLEGIICTEAMRAQFEEVFAPVMALNPERPFRIIPTEEFRPGPSDHAEFVRRGVPAIHWTQDRAGYDYIHHTQHDKFEAADTAQQKHSATTIALAAWGFANHADLVDREGMSKPPNRLMGVNLQGNEVSRITDGGKAAEAGWKVGDVILSIDGARTRSRASVVNRLQEGGPRKTVVLGRGEEEIETVLDYSDDPAEDARAAYRASKAAREAVEKKEDDGGE